MKILEGAVAVVACSRQRMKCDAHWRRRVSGLAAIRESVMPCQSTI